MTKIIMQMHSLSIPVQCLLDIKQNTIRTQTRPRMRQRPFHFDGHPQLTAHPYVTSGGVTTVYKQHICDIIVNTCSTSHRKCRSSVIVSCQPHSLLALSSTSYRHTIASLRMTANQSSSRQFRHNIDIKCLLQLVLLHCRNN
jgi:hypothetical protein